MDRFIYSYICNNDDDDNDDHDDYDSYDCNELIFSYIKYSCTVCVFIVTRILIPMLL